MAKLRLAKDSQEAWFLCEQTDAGIEVCRGVCGSTVHHVKQLMYAAGHREYDDEFIKEAIEGKCEWSIRKLRLSLPEDK